MQPLTERVFLSFQILLFVIGGVANLTVVFIVWKHKGLHTSTNYFLFNLAIADFLTLLSGTTIDIALAWVRHGRLHEESHNTTNDMNSSAQTCILSDNEGLLLRVSFVSCSFKIVSDLTLMCLAIGRYTALVKTLSSVTNILHRKVTIAMIWLIPALDYFVEELLSAIYYTYDTTESIYNIRISFSTLSTFFLCILPTSIIVFCYGSIIKGIYFDKTILAEAGNSIRFNRRIVNRLLIVTSLSVSSTIPAVGFYAYLVWYGRSIKCHIVENMFPVIASTEKIVATVNPIIYSLLNMSYRKAFRKMLRASTK